MASWRARAKRSGWAPICAFVVARVHPSLRGGPDLIHADAYRITDLGDLETLDLDSSLDEAVTVVEWGEGKTEAMSPERLVIDVRRADGGQACRDGHVIDLEYMDDGMRSIVLHAHGSRWNGILDGLVAAHGGRRLDAPEAPDPGAPPACGDEADSDE